MAQETQAPRYWQLREAHDACSAVETSVNTPRFFYPYGAMDFHSRVGN
jgi:hypothetical protein